MKKEKLITNNSEKYFIGNTLKKLIREKGIKESELCKSIDVSLATLYRLLNSETNASIPTLHEIAKYFNVTIGQLLGLEPLENEDSGITSLNNNYSEFSLSLFNDISNEFYLTCESKEKSPKNLKQAVSIICEIYDYTSSKPDKKLEHDFIEWIIRRSL